MLDRVSSITSLGKQSWNATGRYLFVSLYSFKVEASNENVKYTVECHHYPENFVVLKFFPTRESLNEKRYELVLNNGVLFASTVLSSVIAAIEKERVKYEKCSFGFIGAERFMLVTRRLGMTITRESDKRIERPSKRFLIYQHISHNLVDPDAFHLHVREDDNALILVNADCFTEVDSSDYAEEILKMMRDEYPDLRPQS